MSWSCSTLMQKLATKICQFKCDFPKDELSLTEILHNLCFKRFLGNAKMTHEDDEDVNNHVNDNKDNYGNSEGRGNQVKQICAGSNNDLNPNFVLALSLHQRNKSRHA